MRQFRVGGSTQKTATSAINWSRLAAIPLAVMVLLLLTLLWHYSFHKNLKVISNIQKNIAAVANKSPLAKQMPWLVKLNILDKTLRDIHANKTTTYAWTGLTQSADLKRSIAKAYHQVLNDSFKPYLTNILITGIKNSLNKNKVDLYSSLRAYLMLTVPKHFNANAIIHWFELYWRQRYPQQIKLQQQLKQHLQNLLALNPTWSPNQALIQQARDVLNKLSKAQFAFIELQGQYPPKNIAILKRKIPGIDVAQTSIPDFYSPENFNTILKEKIPQVSQLLDRENWVLGTSKNDLLTARQRQQLTTKVKQLYLQYYTQEWLALIANIQFKTPKNLKDIQQHLQLMRHPHSPLNILLKTIINNVNLALQNGDETLKQDQRFKTIKAFVTQTGRYKEIQIKLTDFNNYLNKIISDKEVNKASYNAAVARFNQPSKNNITHLINLSKTLNAPLRGWLQSIAKNSWILLLQNSRVYINQIWQRLVLPFYRKKIKEHFPIYADSKKDISFKDFTSFFGPNGTMQDFFQYLLKPFVNISGNYWVWRKLDGKSIPISQEHLNMFLRASLIQKMFYTLNLQQPSMKFHLTPMLMSNKLNSFVINLGGQDVIFEPEDKNPAAFTWPGPSPGFVTIRFNTKQGKNPTITTTGPWAWLRLLNKASIESSTNPRLFKLTFRSDDYTVSFQLTAGNAVNPYLQGILEAFRCPEEL